MIIAGPGAPRWPPSARPACCPARRARSRGPISTRSRRRRRWAGTAGTASPRRSPRRRRARPRRIMAEKLLPLRLRHLHRRHPVVRAGAPAATTTAPTPMLGDGRLRPAAARAQPLPVGGRRRRLRAARRLRSTRSGLQVRHPPDARHPAAGGRAATCRCSAPRIARARHRRHAQHLPVEPRHVRRRHAQARRAGLLRQRLRALSPPGASTSSRWTT